MHKHTDEGEEYGKVRVIEIKESVFADNDATSKAIREKMSAAENTIFKCYVRTREWENYTSKCIDQQNERSDENR